MLIYHRPQRGLARFLPLLGAFVCALSNAPTLSGQERRYVFEVGAAGAYQSFDDATELNGAPGVILRAGVWLPLNFSVEGEGALSSPKDQTAEEGVSVKSFSASALYNLLIGNSSSAYLKLGYGSTSYGGCPDAAPPDPIICGRSGALIAGLGF